MIVDAIVLQWACTWTRTQDHSSVVASYAYCTYCIGQMTLKLEMLENVFASQSN